MPRRLLIWALSLPLVGASVLVGHRLAYDLTGAEQGPMHDYLAHAPQVLAVLALLALVGLALEVRSGGVAPRSFVALGMVAFALQEHLERIAHGDAPGLLVLDRTFLLGLLLQVPVGLLVAWLARRVVVALRAPAPARSRPPLVASLPLVAVAVDRGPAPRALPSAVLGRGPPRAPRP